MDLVRQRHAGLTQLLHSRRDFAPSVLVTGLFPEDLVPHPDCDAEIAESVGGEGFGDGHGWRGRLPHLRRNAPPRIRSLSAAERCPARCPDVVLRRLSSLTHRRTLMFGPPVPFDRKVRRSAGMGTSVISRLARGVPIITETYGRLQSSTPRTGSTDL